MIDKARNQPADYEQVNGVLPSLICLDYSSLRLNGLGPHKCRAPRSPRRASVPSSTDASSFLIPSHDHPPWCSNLVCHHAMFRARGRARLDVRRIPVRAHVSGSLPSEGYVRSREARFRLTRKLQERRPCVACTRACDVRTCAVGLLRMRWRAPTTLSTWRRLRR
jgi:hypothetical protein